MRPHLQYALPISLSIILAFATCTVFVRDAWPLACFQIAVFALLAIAALTLDWPQRPQLAGFLPVLLPFWGLLQLLTGSTSSTSETRSAILRLGALVAVYILAFRLSNQESARRVFLNGFVWFATASAVLCLTQLFTSNGQVLWLFDTGYPDVYGTFPYYNNYAQFVELALPIALWRALTDRRHAWAYAVAGGTLYASAIGCASRAGSILATLELIAILLVGLVHFRGSRSEERPRLGIATLAIVPVIAIAFTAVVGWDRVWQRFFVNDPYVVRREFLIAATSMVKQRPWIGFGLDTFPEVYQRYAIKDFPFYANHAHNDWAEAAAEGGLPFLAILFIPFAIAVPKAIRHPWALGLAAVMFHACVDYPFARPAVSGWMFALLGLIYATERSTHQDPLDQSG